MSAPTDAMDDSNFSDFDNSDEDLASLLADDDDDIFAKKTPSKSPSKKPENEKTLGTGISSNKATDSNQSNCKSSIADIIKTSAAKSSNSSKSDESKYLDDLGFNQLSDETMSPKTNSRNSLKSKSTDAIIANSDDDDDILKSLESKNKPSCPKRRGSFFDDFLKTLSPKKPPKPSAVLGSLNEQIADAKNKDIDSEEDDILKSLESNDKSTSSHKKSDSNFDDFLKSISPKQSPKKTASLKKNDSIEDSLDMKFSDKKRNEHEKDDKVDIFDKFLSTDAEKSKPLLQRHSTPENKRETFQKQVSFKDTPISSPEGPSPVKALPQISPKRQPDPVVSDLKTKSASQSRRSERLGASSNKDDTDWLNFFKESPKKNKQSNEPPEKDDLTVRTQSAVIDTKTSASRRRSSNAEWLGLSDSKTGNKLSVNIESGKSKSEKEFSSDWLGSGEPMTNSGSRSSLETSTKNKIPSRPQTSSLDWLGNTNPSIEPHKTAEIVNSSDSISKNIIKDTAKNPNDNGIPNSQDIVKSSVLHNSLPSTTEIESSTRYPEANISNRTITSDPAIVLNTTAHTNNSLSKIGVLTHETSSASDSNVNALQAIINAHVLERNQLLCSLESSHLMHEQMIATMENLHRNQMKALEESLKSQETKHKLETERIVKDFEVKLDLVKNEKNNQENYFKSKLEDVEKEHIKEVLKLKELQGQSVALMKQDHEDALLRLKRLKEQEIEAVLSTQAHSRSLQHFSEQLEARTAELASLQAKIEERNQGALREKQAFLEAKEQDLKNLQNRLNRQLEAGDDERTRLQQLVLRLESRLQMCTTEGEEDRWEVQQLKAKLLVQQKYLDEEYKLNMQQVEKEKEKLRLSQDGLLHEQKTVLLQMAQERQLLMQEKLDLESLAKKVKEEEIRFNVKKLKEETFFERQKQSLQQEESKLQFEKSNMKQESEFLEQECEVLQREKKLILEERSKLGDLTFKLKQKEIEVEAKEMWAIEERERSKVEHSVSQKLKMEQQSKMEHMTQKIQELMEKEHQILAEKESLTTQRLELENRKNSTLCNKCKISVGFPMNTPPVSTNTAAMTSINNTQVTEYQYSNLISNHLSLPRPDPSLVVWYITAQKDREYLQEELSFLKSLKDSYKK